MPRGLLLEEDACVPGWSAERPPPLCISSLSLSHTHALLAVTQPPTALPGTGHEPLGRRVSRGALPPPCFFYFTREPAWEKAGADNLSVISTSGTVGLSTESNLLLWSPFNAPSRWLGGEEGVRGDNLRNSWPIRDDDTWQTWWISARHRRPRRLRSPLIRGQTCKHQKKKKSLVNRHRRLCQRLISGPPTPGAHTATFDPLISPQASPGFALGVLPFSRGHILRILAAHAIPTICTDTINPEWAGCFPLGSFKVHINQWLMKSRDVACL